ncbi:MAG: alpha/beta fold hydrolase [bacterium]
MINYFNSPKKGIKIGYNIYKAEKEVASALFLTGRAEYFFKYNHFYEELNKVGVSVYTMDHRGQGASERMLENQYKGHVENFEYFVDDAQFFVKEYVLPSINKELPLYSISHSMGGAISFLLESRLKVFNKIVFCSPMWGINFNAVPEKVIFLLLKALYSLKKEDDFVWGRKNFEFTNPFVGNILTHSKERYKSQVEFLDKNPDFNLGAPTNRWVFESILAMRKIANLSKDFATEALLLQSGDDKVVDNKRQDEVVKNMKNSRKVVIKNAFHELLNEEKVFYNQAVTEILSFLSES